MWVKQCHVLKDGTARQLCDGIKRVSKRFGLDKTDYVEALVVKQQVFHTQNYHSRLEIKVIDTWSPSYISYTLTHAYFKSIL